MQLVKLINNKIIENQEKFKRIKKNVKKKIEKNEIKNLNIENVMEVIDIMVKVRKYPFFSL